MNYRSTLEVAKYLKASTVMQLALVSKEWNYISGSDELWCTILEHSGLAPYRLNSSYKDSYRIQKRNERLLVFIKQRKLLSYNCRAKRWLPSIALAEYSLQFDDASLTLLPEGSLLVLGIIISNSSKAVYCVSNQGVISRLSDTLNIRIKTGALCCGSTVYAFGSLSYQESRTCEKMILHNRTALEQNRWQPLPNMLDSRFRFVPVEFAGSVYLNGGWCNTCEVFELRTERFSMLKLKLGDHHDCFTAVSIKRMEVFTFGKVYVNIWSRKRLCELKRPILGSESTRVLSCLRVKQRLYTVQDWGVYVYDLDDGYKVKRIEDRIE